jgi:hypothetical protein
MSNPGRVAFVVVVVFVAVGALRRPAEAGDNTIRQPGDHPNYAIEIEPHMDFAWFDYAPYNAPGLNSSPGVGLGARFTIPIVKNGFVTTINNTVGIGFGADWLYFGCNPNCGLSTLYFPVVMQWNFYVAHSWSVFGEPGFSFDYAFYNNGVCKGSCFGSAFFPGPVFEVGGRYHINEHLALTARIGYPDFTFGVSFM